MSIDRLANMLSTIKNTSMAGRSVVEISYTKTCEAVAKVLKEAGFLKGVSVFKPSESTVKMLHLDLDPSITDVKQLSKPGRRLYKGVDELRKVAGGYGVLVISTPKGIMSGDQAKKQNLGGEVLCEVF